MADWFYIGYCTVMAMFAVAVAYAAAFGFRALRRLPRSLLVGFAAAAVVATLTAQKTNNVPPNMNSPLSQMQQGGGFSQTGFTGLTGLSGALPHMPSSLNPVNLVNPVQDNILVQTTNADISRGWRVECVATNENLSYVMPTNATLVGNWHIHGARSSFGNNRIDFGDWRFPLGTNDEAFSAFWYFIDGRIRPAPRDATHEICAAGVPMFAVPGESRLWRLDSDDGARILTWENFFLGGDTNSPVNAQIVLSPNGDFLTRSNEVETVCRRVNPDDWDDDGIPNDADANPTICDGDFFGPSNILPAGANTNAYCTISVVATGPDALVTFAGDKPSNYPDPRFVAKSGVTNEVVILIGKTYTISSDWPFAVVGVSDPDTEVWQMRGAAHQTYVCRPVTISASDGNPFTMSVVPLNLGGVFLWPSTQCSCSISGGGDTFTWNCPTSCTCCGCNVEGQYSYEGYWLPVTGCLCECYYDGTGPKWEPSSAPLAASVSASFSKSAVIFEDAYENLPGQLVEKRSERTRLNIVAHGGPNGASLSVAVTNFSKLSHISGPGLPLADVAIPANTSVSYAIVYEGNEASLSTNDIVISAEIADNVTSEGQDSHTELTCIRVIIQEEDIAPAGVCTNRHTYGVGESLRMLTMPIPAGLEWSASNGVVSTLRYSFPLSSAETPALCLSYGGATYYPSLSIVEPHGFRSENVAYETLPRPDGYPGGIILAQDFHLCPEYVNFRNLSVQEFPWRQGGFCEGYFARPSEAGSRYHTEDNGAGNWMYVNPMDHYVGRDRAGRRAITNDWCSGSLVWDIPIGWKQRDSTGGVYKISSSPFPQQILRLDENGTMRIDKCGHWVSRELNGNIYKDGVLQ